MMVMTTSSSTRVNAATRRRGIKVPQCGTQTRWLGKQGSMNVGRYEGEKVGRGEGVKGGMIFDVGFFPAVAGRRRGCLIFDGETEFWFFIGAEVDWRWREQSRKEKLSAG